MSILKRARQIEAQVGGKPKKPKPEPKTKESSGLETQVGSRADRTKSQLDKQLRKDNGVAVLSGNTKELLHDGDISYDVRDFLVQYASNYQIVLIYNPTTGKFKFANEQSKTSFGELGVDLFDEAGNNIVGKIFDDATLKSIQRTDRICFDLMSRAIEKAESKGVSGENIFLIVDRAEKLFGEQGEKDNNPQILGDLKTQIRSAKGLENRIVLIDRGGQLSRESVSNEVDVIKLPENTEADVEKVFKDFGIEPSKDIVTLARTVNYLILSNLLSEMRGASAEEVKSALIKIVEKTINDESGGVVESKLSRLTPEQVAMSEGEEKLWENVKKLIHTNPDVISAGTLLIGPPGTGKTIRAEYLASKLGLPFLKITNTSSSGLAGVKEDRFRRAIETAIKNKPCVLFLDEMDKAFPRTEGNGLFTHNDDLQVAAYIQSMVGSKEMEGVIFVGGCNDPDQMNEALLRNGRFGYRIGVLPPGSVEERIKIINAVKNQISALRDYVFDEEFLQLIAQKFPENTTGADIKAILQEASTEMLIENRNLEEVILELIGKSKFEKNAKFEKFIEIAKDMHTAKFIPWEKESEETEKEIDEAVLLARWKDKVQKREAKVRNVEDRSAQLAQEIESLEKQRTALNERVREAQEMLDIIHGEQAKITSEEADRKAKLDELERQVLALQEENRVRGLELDGKELAKTKDYDALVADMSEIQGSYYGKMTPEEIAKRAKEIREQRIKEQDPETIRRRAEAAERDRRNFLRWSLGIGTLVVGGGTWFALSEGEANRQIRERISKNLPEFLKKIGTEIEKEVKIDNLTFKYEKDGGGVHTGESNKRPSEDSSKYYTLVAQDGDMKWFIRIFQGDGHASEFKLYFGLQQTRGSNLNPSRAFLKFPEPQTLEEISKQFAKMRLLRNETVTNFRQFTSQFGAKDIGDNLVVEGLTFVPRGGNGDIESKDWYVQSNPMIGSYNMPKYCYEWRVEGNWFRIYVTLGNPNEIVHNGTHTVEEIKEIIRKYKAENSIFERRQDLPNDRKRVKEL